MNQSQMLAQDETSVMLNADDAEGQLTDAIEEQIIKGFGEELTREDYLDS